MHEDFQINSSYSRNIYEKSLREQKTGFKNSRHFSKRYVITYHDLYA